MIAPITTIGIIALGGAIGAVARYGVSIISTHFTGNCFPWATLIVNVIGSFLMGILIVKLSEWMVSQDLKLFYTTGVLGAFTTFSTFSFDAVTLWQRGDMLHAVIYMMASVILSIGALLFALWFVKGSTL